MVESRQRAKESELIIKTERIWWREVFMWLFSGVMWGYCLIILSFFASGLFNLNLPFINLFKISFKMDNSDIRMFLGLMFSIGVLFFIILFLWSLYNKKRFGSLRRRHYPAKTSEQDILGLQLVSKETYRQLQNEKVIIFTKNPIRNRDQANK